MQHQDWNTVNIGRQSGGSLTKEEISLKERQAKREGKAVSYHRISKGDAPDNSRKLDDATEANKIEKLKCGKEIMQARCAKKMTRKQLASSMNMKEEIIASFENNSVLGTPANKKILEKIKRKLGIRQMQKK